MIQRVAERVPQSAAGSRVCVIARVMKDFSPQPLKNGSTEISEKWNRREKLMMKSRPMLCVLSRCSSRRHPFWLPVRRSVDVHVVACDTDQPCGRPQPAPPPHRGLCHALLTPSAPAAPPTGPSPCECLQPGRRHCGGLPPLFSSAVPPVSPGHPDPVTRAFLACLNRF